MDADDNSFVPPTSIGEAKTEQPKLPPPTREQLIEMVDGLLMRCENQEALINALKKRNEILSLDAKTATVKAHGYKLLMKEMLHEVLVTKLQEPVHEELHGPTSQN